MGDYQEGKSLQNVVKIYLVLSILSAVFYFSYLFNPQNIGNIYVYILLVFAEIYIFVQSVGTWYTLLQIDEKTKPYGFRQFKKRITTENRIDGGVDVFITVAGEPIDILRPTLEAALKIKVEHDTYLLDDLGDRFSDKNKPYKELAEQLGVKYIKTEDNKLYKVGSLNYGLARTSGKYFANFDSDFIPNENFLIETLPYFMDEKVGWVQTPQAFRNNTNFLSKGSSDAVEAFYNFTMPGKNSFNSALFVGTNAAFRREAIESIGGFKYHHSEDVYTGYMLHQSGWKSVAVPKKLAYGLNPDDTTSLFKQSLRWSGGTLEIFFYDSIIGKRLNLDQKLQYFITFSFYLYGFVILIMIIMPILYLLFGVKPLQSLGAEWAIHYIPYFIFQFSTIALFASRLSFPAMIVSMNLYPIYIRGLINGIRRKHSKWVVTHMKGNKNTIVTTLVNLYWHLIVVLISIIALIIGAANVREPLTFALSFFWVVANMVLTIVFVREAIISDNKKNLFTTL